MDSPAITLAAWSYGLAAVAYGLLVVRFWRSAGTGLRGLALVIAFGVTAAWAASNWGFVALRVRCCSPAGTVSTSAGGGVADAAPALMRGPPADDPGAYARSPGRRHGPRGRSC
jgi:hypothetical protein